MNAIEIDNLRFFYPHNRRQSARPILDGLTFSVTTGEIFGLLGPNGGGKSTLFKVLTTLVPPSSGQARIMSEDVAQNPRAVRSKIGVVFQNPSLDKKLTVLENLLHQGRLYGLQGNDLRSRCIQLLHHFSMYDRRDETVEFLSGGMQRRAEIIKGLIHKPQVLLMDEPSTGLDPAARRDMWEVLRKLKTEGITVLLTTHLMEEAEKCDRVGIVHQGKLVALGTPDQLKSAIGGDIVTIHGRNLEIIKEGLASKFKAALSLVDGSVRMEISDGHKIIPSLVESLPGEIDSISVGKPTLEDVFINRTGRRFEEPS